jgi:hypothetical protein
MPDRIKPDRNSQIGDRHTEPGRTQTDMIQSEGNRQPKHSLTGMSLARKWLHRTKLDGTQPDMK